MVFTRLWGNTVKLLDCVYFMLSLYLLIFRFTLVVLFFFQLPVQTLGFVMAKTPCQRSYQGMYFQWIWCWIGWLNLIKVCVWKGFFAWKWRKNVLGLIKFVYGMAHPLICMYLFSHFCSMKRIISRYNKLDSSEGALVEYKAEVLCNICLWFSVVEWLLLDGQNHWYICFFFVNFLSLVRNCLLFWSSCALPWHMIIVFLFSVYFVEGFDHLKKDTKGVKIWGKNAIYHIKRKIYLSHKKLCNLFRQCLVPKKIDGKCKGKKIEKKKWRKILGYVWFLENLKENAKERKYKGKVEGK